MKSHSYVDPNDIILNLAVWLIKRRERGERRDEEIEPLILASLLRQAWRQRCMSSKGSPFMDDDRSTKKMNSCSSGTVRKERKFQQKTFSYCKVRRGSLPSPSNSK